MRRQAEDRGQRDPISGRTLYRYRCSGCEWQGLLARRRRSLPTRHGTAATVWAAQARRLARAAHAGRVPWAQVGSVLLAASVLALVAVQGVRHVLNPSPPAATVAAVPAGISHDGEDLPTRHPWLQPAVLTAATAAAGAPGAAPPPLSMRRGCAWGQPGRNPYRGTAEQALLHARLPAEVVTDIAAKIARKDRSDRLDIRRGSIVAQRQGRHFDAEHIAMSFGNTLCLNTRVNFAPGHTEGADLYEARDAQGRGYAVMVPDVCGNVSVLGERGERSGKRPVEGVLAVAANARVEHARWALLASGDDPGGSLALPGSAGLALAALGALGLITHLRQRRCARR